MSGIERANGLRLAQRNSPFPQHWGDTPSDVDERAGWIVGNLAADLAVKGCEVRVRALDPRVEVRRTLDPRLALLALRAKERLF